MDAYDAKISRELTQMRNGPLALAVGFEHRKEKLVDNVDPIFSSGNILGGGGNLQNQDADRDVTGVFGEFSIPILRNLEAQVAARYDRYAIRQHLNPKVALRWTPSRNAGRWAPTHGIPRRRSPTFSVPIPGQ